MHCKPEDFVSISNDLGAKLIKLLNENAFEKVIICFNQFVSVMVQEPIAKQILPMQLDSDESATAVADSSESNCIGKICFAIGS